MNKQELMAKAGELFFQRENLTNHLRRIEGDIQIVHDELAVKEQEEAAKAEKKKAKK
jgi:uncharacterized protein YdaU (DUF1376 family)